MTMGICKICRRKRDLNKIKVCQECDVCLCKNVCKDKHGIRCILCSKNHHLKCTLTDETLLTSLNQINNKINGIFNYVCCGCMEKNQNLVTLQYQMESEERVNEEENEITRSEESQLGQAETSQLGQAETSQLEQAETSQVGQVETTAEGSDPENDQENDNESISSDSSDGTESDIEVNPNLEVKIKRNKTTKNETARNEKICWNYTKGTCIFGRKCNYNHPTRCRNMLTTGHCKYERNCKYNHPKICHNSTKYKKCLNLSCPFFHIKGTLRRETPGESQITEVKNQNIGNNNNFLEEFQNMRAQLQLITHQLKGINWNTIPNTINSYSEVRPPQMMQQYQQQPHQIGQQQIQNHRMQNTINQGMIQQQQIHQQLQSQQQQQQHYPHQQQQQQQLQSTFHQQNQLNY